MRYVPYSPGVAMKYRDMHKQVDNPNFVDIRPTRTFTPKGVSRGLRFRYTGNVVAHMCPPETND